LIVVDACVAIKWFLPEPGSEQALDLFRNSEALIAPEVIRWEVAGAITRRVRRGDLTQGEAKQILAMWLDALKEGVLQTTSTLEDLREAGNLSLQLHHGLADCLYIALARRTGARLVTADRGLHDKTVALYAKVAMLA
jgi:predicted nucleic acid-binding protein